jgi:hypothetical protein
MALRGEKHGCLNFQKLPVDTVASCLIARRLCKIVCLLVDSVASELFTFPFTAHSHLQFKLSSLSLSDNISL